MRPARKVPTAKKVGKKVKPKFMLTYLCPRCGLDSAMTEQQPAHCFYCENTKDLDIIKKQKITPQVMAARMKLVNDRLLDALQKAYQTLPKNGDGREEGALLHVMAKAKNLREGVAKLKLRRRK